MVFGLIAAASILIQPIEVWGYDPPAADVWEQSVLFKCGSSTLRISGYGVGRPSDRKAEITFNGQPLRGEKVDMLVRDLSDPVAIYRIGARCGKGEGRFGLPIQMGKKTEAGDIIYRSGSALIVNGTLESYEGLEPVSAESFWFR